MNRADAREAVEAAKAVMPYMAGDANEKHYKLLVAIGELYLSGKLVEPEYNDLTAAYMAGVENGKDSVVLGEREIEEIALNGIVLNTPDDLPYYCVKAAAEEIAKTIVERMRE